MRKRKPFENCEGVVLGLRDDRRCVAAFDVRGELDRVVAVEG
jgi:hypothetical protein